MIQEAIKPEIHAVLSAHGNEHIGNLAVFEQKTHFKITFVSIEQ